MPLIIVSVIIIHNNCNINTYVMRKFSRHICSYAISELKLASTYYMYSYIIICSKLTQSSNIYRCNVIHSSICLALAINVLYNVTILVLKHVYIIRFICTIFFPLKPGGDANVLKTGLVDGHAYNLIDIKEVSFFRRRFINHQNIISTKTIQLYIQEVEESQQLETYTNTIKYNNM